ncbi:penicillin-binding protein 2 [Desulfotruncus alcoholivorax]|uniref:penicillin-binding protein 2 n=1 Tax=Desulfotruncus alcoholivorax TaxID=265477 RepID=UPI00041E59ED|nr:penicillin-binding protein 2 [Desulfotruncus alcoholivorax]
MKKKIIEFKMKFVLGGVFLVLLVLIARISFMQLVQTEQFRTLARNNYIRIVPIFAPRGEIFDRNGEKIVTNRPIYTVSINDLNFEGTTYRLYLNRVGADTVQMADTLSWVLAGDDETVAYFEQVSGNKVADFARENGIDDITKEKDKEKVYTIKKKFIEEAIKERAKEQKSLLEQGEKLEMAVVYNPSTAAELRRQNLAQFGVTMEKKTDTLSRLVAMLAQANILKDQSVYQKEAEVRAQIRENRVNRPYEPVMVAEDVPFNVVVALREKQMELPGVIVDVQPVREYPHGELLTHVLGYVQSIKKEQYEQHKDEGYLINDLYGQNGLEYVYEKQLRGEHGARQMEVDARGRPVRDLGLKPAVPGDDLVLTVDLDLQKATEQALAEGTARARKAGFGLSRAGAAIVMDVRTGAILAMASYPSYNPGIFTGGLSAAQWQDLQQSGALLNRAISATYAPGSTFKMVTAAAILQNHIADPTYKIADPGYYKLGQGIFKDWKPGGHGLVDLRKALEQSCDTYFYQFGRAAGVNNIARAAKEFGLGGKTGINLPGEMSGRVPTPEWKYEMVKNMLINYNGDFSRVRELDKMIDAAKDESRKQELTQERDKELEKQLKKHEWDLNWQQFETVNMAIGQGDNTYTPLQLVSYVAAIANGGTLYTPFVVERVISPQGKVIQENSPKVRHKVDVDPKNLEIIREGMHMVTLPPTGTASGVFNGFNHSAAAKTGTAEVLDAHGNKKGNHALFVSFTPYEKPEIAVVVVLEYGNSGSGYAGPIARQIMDAYYAEKDGVKKNDRQIQSLDQPAGPGTYTDPVIPDYPSVWPEANKQGKKTTMPDNEKLRYYSNQHRAITQPASQSPAKVGRVPPTPPAGQGGQQLPINKPPAEQQQPQQPTQQPPLQGNGQNQPPQTPEQPGTTELQGGARG